MSRPALSGRETGVGGGLNQDASRAETQERGKWLAEVGTAAAVVLLHSDYPRPGKFMVFGLGRYGGRRRRNSDHSRDANRK